MFLYCNLYIYTAATQEYADPIIDELDKKRIYFKGRYYRANCVDGYYKNIQSLEIKDKSQLENIVIIDDNTRCHTSHTGIYY
jgi:TFIIF-interacting CTD phosphatase-like protein